MIFAPVIRRAGYAQAPRSADLALQRFLMGTLADPTAARSAAGCTVTQDDKATTLQLDVPGLTREQRPTARGFDQADAAAGQGQTQTGSPVVAGTQ